MNSFSLLFSLLAVQPQPDACRGPFDRDAVVRCAAAASPRVRADREAVTAAQADASAAGVLLPSNPIASVTVGRRWNTTGDRATNVTGSLSQQVEIAGQRRRRIDVAAAEREARESQTEGTERDVVADALLAYYDVLAAREELDIIERASATAARLREVARARAEAGLGNPMETQLAAADEAGLRERAALSRGRVLVAQTRLASALGMDPTAEAPQVHGGLDPLPGPRDLQVATNAATARPEVRHLEARRRAEAARVRLLQRERMPSPSFSVFAQTDGFNERIVGGGLSFPIPLPFPLGRTNKGQIEAAQARTREADQRVEAAGRQMTLEATLAHHDLGARAEAAAAYPADTRDAAQQSLKALAGEIEGGRLPVRDALVTQQALIELLLRAVEADHALCRASVALALASGARFGGGAR